jgi:DHA1 family tetracycline resistance protein-like MFS transporter
MLKNKNASLGFIFATILIDIIGLGIIIPVIPDLIENLVGGGMTEASKYGGWLLFSYAIMQFLFAPILGGLSDRFGRRPVLLIALLGLGLDYILHAYAPTITWLFIGRIFAGICGGSITTATAYIADITDSDKRAQNFGLIGVAFGLGFIIGPVIGGSLSQWGIQVPFLVAAGLSFLNLIYGIFILPESLPKENRRKFNIKRANPIGSLINIKKYPNLLNLVISIFLLNIAAHAIQSNWTFFTKYKFNWNADMVGYSLGFVGLLIAIVQGILIRVIVPKLGERKTIYFGFSMWFIGMVLFSVADQGWMMFAILVPYALGGLAGPTIQGKISNFVPNNEQGEMQGTLTSLISVTSIIGPLLMTQIFAFTTKDDTPFYFPGAPFALGAILIFISAAILFGKLKKTYPDIKSDA